MYDILELNKKLVSDLREIGKELKIKRVESLKKQDLIYRIDFEWIGENGSNYHKPCYNLRLRLLKSPQILAPNWHQKKKLQFLRL